MTSDVEIVEVGTNASDIADGHRIDWMQVYRRLVVYFELTFALNRWESSDAAQSALERLIRAEDKRDRDKPFLPWCYRIACNYGIDRYRAKKRGPRLEAVPVETMHADSRYQPESAFERSELKRAVNMFIEQLESSDREIAFLRFYEELSYREISRLRSTASGTVRYRVHRIRRDLRRYLEREGFYE